MNASIERISAQNDIRRLSVGISSQNGEAAQDARNRLMDEIGTVVVAKAVVDRQGLDDLKQMAFI